MGKGGSAVPKPEMEQGGFSGDLNFVYSDKTGFQECSCFREQNSESLSSLQPQELVRKSLAVSALCCSASIPRPVVALDSLEELSVTSFLSQESLSSSTLLCLQVLGRELAVLLALGDQGRLLCATALSCSLNSRQVTRAESAASRDARTGVLQGETRAETVRKLGSFKL